MTSSTTPPNEFGYSLDKYFARERLPLTFDSTLYEVRLLTVTCANRGTHVGFLHSDRPNQETHRMLRRFVASIVTLALASGTLTAQAGSSATPRVRIMGAGQQTSGRLTAVDAEALTIMPDGKRDPIRIPLSSVSAAEVSEGKRPRALAILAGVGAGLVAATFAFIVAANGTTDKGGIVCDACFKNGFIAGGIVGTASGVATWHLIGRERWRSVPLTSLASLVP